MRKSHLFAVLILLVFSVFVSGCITTEYAMDFKDDGSQVTTINITAPSMLSSDQTDTMKTDLQKKGYTVKQSSDKDGNVVVTGEKTLPSGKWELPYDTSIIAGDPKFTSSFTNLLVYKAWNFEASYSFDKKKVAQAFGKDASQDSSASTDGQDMGDYTFDVNYKITVPGTVSENNANETVTNPDGTTTLKWSYNTGKTSNVDLKMKSSKVYVLPIVVIAVILLAIIGLVVVLILRKKPQPPIDANQSPYNPPGA